MNGFITVVAAGSFGMLIGITGTVSSIRAVTSSTSYKLTTMETKLDRIERSCAEYKK